MKTFQCTHCNSLIFFDSQTCLHCGSHLGFEPHSLRMLALDVQTHWPSSTSDAHKETACNPPSPHSPDPISWVIKNPTPAQSTHSAPVSHFKYCQNFVDFQNCNFLLSASDHHRYCLSCRQTATIPNLAIPGNVFAWTTIENAKRRLFYTLAKLGLEKTDHPPRYDFLEDSPGQEPVMTGHANGLITLNIAEADDAERTRRRMNLHEPYRTLLGHLRHEVGHYYWDQFFRDDAPALQAFRALFGDERLDYAQALEQHYAAPRTDWQLEHISPYAAAHAWEDWAETWAHYLHLLDLQETAASYQLQFTTNSQTAPWLTRVDDPFMLFAQAPQDGSPQDMDAVLHQAMGVSLLLNSLNRSLGHNDAYPFAHSSVVLAKLAFVHNAVRRYVHQTTQRSSTQVA